MSSSATPTPADLRVGLCGFSMAMKQYATRFPVVEVQSTFYDPPADNVIAGWRAQTGPALEYTMKVWQRVTHPASSPTYRRAKQSGPPPADVGGFQPSQAVAHAWARSVECAAIVDATTLLFQCPASFTPEPANVARLRRFFERIERPAGRRLAWEPRGAAWVEQRELAQRLCDELDLTYAVDPFVTPPRAGTRVYWRLHGRGGARHSYTDDELGALHGMLDACAAPGPRHVLFNNLPRAGDARRFILMREGTANQAPPRA